MTLAQAPCTEAPESPCQVSTIVPRMLRVFTLTCTDDFRNLHQLLRGHEVRDTPPQSVNLTISLLLSHHRELLYCRIGPITEVDPRIGLACPDCSAPQGCELRVMISCCVHASVALVGVTANAIDFFPHAYI